MSEPGSLGARLRCECHLCLYWRRLGEEVHLGHQNLAFQEKALEVLRGAFDQLLGYREAHRLELWDPLAGGSLGSTRPQEVTGESPEKGRSPSRSRRGRRRKSKSEDSEEGKSAKKPKKRSTKRSRSRRRAKSAKDLGEVQPVQPGSASASLAGGSEKSEPPSHHRRHQGHAKEEGSEKEDSKEPTKVVEGEVSPARHRGSSLLPSSASGVRLRCGPSTAPTKEGEKSPDREEEPPPGRWSLRERPAEPFAAPRHQRPPEPRGPPPGWVDPRGSFARSKGIVRRERQADIFRYGPDPRRKAEREAKRRG